ncbi:MAG: formylmethanofuran dehydrogenase subunit B [Isosphaeraceae bacterium]|nr:formylmethanofuran dehydrogenase subunit B [Isosphaeraceae bacterium]
MVGEIGGMSSVSSAGPVDEVEHATCIACGCLCDDIVVAVADGQIVRAGNACPVGERWFLSERSRSGVPDAWLEGQPVTRDEAIARACLLLGEARAPVFLGLSRCTTETTAAALALADHVRATIDTDVGGAATARLQAFQRVGRVSATLGEVKNRADVVVFWGCDPVKTHPRHFERYSAEPRGRFVPEGREGRTVIVVDAERTASAECADLFVPVATERGFETLWTLRALLRGVVLDGSRVARATGLELNALAALVGRLKHARYGAWFYGSQGADSSLIEAMFALVRDLNASTRFVAVSLGGAGNPVGAESATAWQTGFAGRVDFQLGYPRSWPGETSAESLLLRGEADLAVVVGEEAASGLSRQARANLGQIPVIRIAPPGSELGDGATVAFATATEGIDAGGTVARADGVLLPLRPALPPRLPTDREWLAALLDHFAGGNGA